MAFPTIGLSAIMDVKDFTKGEKFYTSGLSDMNTKTESTAKRITGALKSIGKIALGVGVAAGGALIGLGGTIAKLAIDAAPVPAIGKAFAALGGDIAAMRKGSLGMVTDVELMKQFNTAAALVSVDFAKTLPAAMELAGKAAAATGKPMSAMLDALTTGVGRVSPMILDNLGITVNLAEANETYAATLNKSVKELTKAEQQTAVMNATMAGLERAYGGVDSVQGTAVQQLGSLSVMFKNLKTDIGVAFLPVLQELLTPLTQLAITLLPDVLRGVKALAEGTLALIGATKGLIAFAQGDIWLGGLADTLMDLSPRLADGANRIGDFVEAMGGTGFGLADVLRAVRTRILQIDNPLATFIADLRGGVGIIGATVHLLSNFVPMDTILRVTRFADSVIVAFRRISAGVVNAFQRIQQQVGFIRKGTRLGGIFGGATVLFGMMGIGGTVIADTERVFTSIIAKLREGFSRIREVIGFTRKGIRLGGIFGGAHVIFFALGIDATVVSDIERAFTRIMASIRRGFDEVKRVVLGVFQEFSTGGLRGGFKAALAKALEIGSTIADFRQKLITKLFDVGRTLLTALGDMFPSIKPLIDEFLIPILNIGETVVTTFTQMKTDIRRVLLSMVGLVREPLEEIGRTFMSVMGNVLAIVDKVWPSVLATIQRIVPAALTIISGIMPVIRTVGDVLETVLGDAIPFVLDLFAQMAEFIADKMPQIQRVITQALAVIEIAWVKVWPILQKVVDIAWGTIQKMIETAINIVEGVISVFLSALEGDWETTWENTKKLLATWVTDILDLVKGVVNDIAKALGVENFDVGAIVSEWIELGKGMIDGLLKGVNDTLGGIKGIFEKAIEKLPKWARDILGAKSPARVFVELGMDIMLGLGKGIDEGQAQVIKKITKAIGRIVNAFNQLVELSVKFGSGGKLPDISGTLDAFEGAIESVLTRLEGIIEKFGEKRIKKIRKSANRLREILDAVMIDLSKIVAIELPDLNTWRDQVIGVTRAVLEVLGHLAFEFGVQAIEDAASWAGSVADLLAIVGPAVDALASLTEFSAIADLPQLAETFADQVLTVVDTFVRIRASFGTTLQADANSWWASAKTVIDIVKPGIDAITALMEYKPIGHIPFLVENFGDRLAEIVNELSLQAKTWKVDVSEDAKKIFAAMTQVLGIVRPGVDAIVALMEYKPIGRIPFLVENFGDRLTEIVNELSKQSKTWKVDVTDDAMALFAAINTIVGVVRPGIDALTSLMDFAQVQGIKSKARDFAEHLGVVVFELAQVAKFFVVAGEDGTFSGLEAAERFGAAAATIVSVVGPGITALTGLMDFAQVQDIKSKARGFAEHLSVVVFEIAQVAGFFVTAGEDGTFSGLEAGERFGAAASTIVSVVQPGIAALASLMDFAQVEGIKDKARDFAEHLSVVVFEIAQVAGFFVTAGEGGTFSGLEAGERFGAAAATIVSVVEPGIKALSSLMDFTRVEGIKDKARDFGADLAIVVREIATVAEEFVTIGPEGLPSGLEAAAAFATAAGQIVGFIEPAIAALASLGTLAETQDLTGKLRLFGRQIGQVLSTIQAIAQGFARGGPQRIPGVEPSGTGGSGLEAAATFASAVATISQGIKSAIDLIDSFMTYKGREIGGGLATFAQNMFQLRNLLIEQADEMETVVPDAERFEAAIATISGAIKAGLDLLVGLPTVGTGLLAGLGARIRSALAEVTAAFTSETSTAAAAAYAYGFTVGRGASFGFRDGFASIPAPTFSVGPATSSTDKSSTAEAPSRAVTVTFGDTYITSEVDASSFKAGVLQIVKEAVRG